MSIFCHFRHFGSGHDLVPLPPSESAYEHNQCEKNNWIEKGVENWTGRQMHGQKIYKHRRYDKKTQDEKSLDKSLWTKEYRWNFSDKKKNASENVAESIMTLPVRMDLKNIIPWFSVWWCSTDYWILHGQMSEKHAQMRNELKKVSVQQLGEIGSNMPGHFIMCYFYTSELKMTTKCDIWTKLKHVLKLSLFLTIVPEFWTTTQTTFKS